MKKVIIVVCAICFFSACNIINKNATIETNNNEVSKVIEKKVEENDINDTQETGKKEDADKPIIVEETPRLIEEISEITDETPDHVEATVSEPTKVVAEEGIVNEEKNVDSDQPLLNEVKEEKDIELTGEFKKFTTKDINNNVIDQSIISNAKLTVLNIWGTFCPPCIDEIPHLSEIAKDYEEKGVQIVGLVSDANSEVQINKAKQILEKSNASYINLLPSTDLEEIYLKNVYYIPETLFIDDTGTILDSIVGAMDKEAWKNKIDEMLKKVND